MKIRKCNFSNAEKRHLFNFIFKNTYSSPVKRNKLYLMYWHNNISSLKIGPRTYFYKYLSPLRQGANTNSYE